MIQRKNLPTSFSLFVILLTLLVVGCGGGGGGATNQAPIADAGEGGIVELNQNVVLDGSGSSDPDGTMPTYSWSFTETPAGSTASISNDDRAVASFEVNAVGTYVVELTVTDGSLDDSDTVTLTVNQYPEASAGNSLISFVDTVIEFDGTGSTDPDEGDSVDSYFWDFGDGDTSDLPSPSHSYSSSDIYTVSLTVTDSRGFTHTDEIAAVISPQVVNSYPLADNGMEDVVSIHAGQIFSLDGSGSSDPDGSVTAWAWDFGDGSTSSATAVEHTWETGGLFKVELVVTDDDGASTKDISFVQVNGAPAVDLESDPESSDGTLTILTNETVTFSATATDPDDGDSISSYTWDFGNDADGSGDTAEVSWSEPGTYTVSVTVADNNGAEAEASLEVVVENRTPTAYAGDNIYCNVGDSVTVIGALSEDLDGNIVSYDWTVNDVAVTGTETNLEYTFSVSGPNTVVLTVTDDDGASDSDEIVVVAADPTVYDSSDPVVTVPEPPTDSVVAAAAANLEETASRSLFDTPILGLPGRPINFDASRSYDPGGMQTGIDVDATMSYSWDLNDQVDNDSNGTFNDDEDSTSSVVSEIYDEAGTYIITLTVTDDDPDSTPVVDTIDVKILPFPNQAPVANAGSNQVVYAGDEVTFDGSESEDSEDGKDMTYSWDFGGVGTGSGMVPVFTFDDPGAYLVTLTVEDKGATGYLPRSDTDTMRVLVKKLIVNEPPVIAFTPIIQAFTDEPVGFDASDSFDADGTIASIEWDFGGGVTYDELKVLHTFSTAATYPVSLTLTDEDGEASELEFDIEVSEPPISVQVDLDYQGSLDFSETNPIALHLYNMSEPLENGPVYTRVVYNSGNFIIQSSELVGIWNETDDFALVAEHGVQNDGSTAGGYWLVIDEDVTGSAGTVMAVFTPIELDAQYSLTFTDSNKAALAVTVW